MPQKAALITLAAATAAHYAFWNRRVRLIHPQLRHPLLYLAPTNGAVALLDTITPPTRRSLPATRPVQGVEYTRVEIPVLEESAGLPGHLYLPQRRDSRGGLLWIHGGGHLFGSAAGYHRYASGLARDLGVPVLSVDYRKASQAPYPADLNDCYAALRWFQQQDTTYRFDSELIAIAGQSAGGGLAAALAQRAADSGHPVNFQSLTYPMLDDRTVLNKNPEGRGAFIWTPRDNRYAWRTYLAGREAAADLPAYAAPARRRTMADLPAAWIGVGERDLFYSENLTYHRRLVAAGVPSEFYEVAGMYHAADMLRPAAPVMQDFYAAMIGALKRSFEG